MATSVSTIEYIENQLFDIPLVRSRKMFGEYALYVTNKVVALVCNDTLFVKITPEGERYVGPNFPTGFPYPGACPAFEIDDDRLDNHAWLVELIKITEKALPDPKPKMKTRR